MLNGSRMKNALNKNIEWFLNSGLMKENDGSKGIAERVVLVEDNDAMERINAGFIYQRKIDHYIILEHVRPDCTFETALVFHLASEVLKRPDLENISRNMFLYLENAPNRNAGGLWGWSDVLQKDDYFTNDNAWVIIVSLYMYQITGEEKFFGMGMETADAMDKEMHKGKQGKLMNPDLASHHGPGELAIAMAKAYKISGEKKYFDCCCRIIDYDYKNLAVKDSILDRKSYDTSKCAYLLMQSSLIYLETGYKPALEICNVVANTLCSLQNKYGGWASEWRESAIGKDYCDIIYAQNWAIMGFYHALFIKKDVTWKKTFEKAIKFLLDIQVKEPDYIAGCWRGQFNIKTWNYNIPDRHEGGPNSIYSGWTNAIIDIVLAFILSGKSLVKS